MKNTKCSFFVILLPLKKNLEYKGVNRKESLKYNQSACILVNNPNVSNELRMMI